MCSDYLQRTNGRGDSTNYNSLVEKYNQDRREYLRKWPGVSSEIVDAI